MLRFCGWSVSASDLERTCLAEGAEVERQYALAPAESVSAPSVFAETTGESAPAAAPQPTTLGIAAAVRLPAAAKKFRTAEGNVEFQTDGTMVNTITGWRELRIALWQKRPAGSPAQPHEWNTRRLPPAAATAVIVGLEPAEAFAGRWRQQAALLGIQETTSITVAADGADWIWKQAGVQFPGSTGVLDIYHACEHLATAARAIYGEATGTALGWTDVGRRWLLTEGWTGICRWVATVRADTPQPSPSQDQAGVSPSSVTATEELLNYFSKHTTHLNYRDRLAAGLNIGSGAVEGAAKQLVGRRLKQTGARWRPENARRMAALCSLEWAGDWHDYWKPPCLASAI